MANIILDEDLWIDKLEGSVKYSDVTLVLFNQVDIFLASKTGFQYVTIDSFQDVSDETNVKYLFVNPPKPIYTTLYTYINLFTKNLVNIQKISTRFGTLTEVVGYAEPISTLTASSSYGENTNFTPLEQYLLLNYYRMFGSCNVTSQLINVIKPFVSDELCYRYVFACKDKNLGMSKRYGYNSSNILYSTTTGNFIEQFY